MTRARQAQRLAGGNAILNNQPSHFSATVTSPDFNLTITPSTLQLSPGTTGFLIVNMTSVNGFSGNITLSGTVQSPITLNLNQTTIMISPVERVSTFALVTVPNSAPPGIYTLNITGTDGPIVHIASAI